MRVLVACEYSAIVRDAFRARGHDAWSCDILPTEGDPKWHFQGDAIRATRFMRWDLIIAHPPCTYLTTNGNAWFKKQPDRYQKQKDALIFFLTLFNSPCEHICCENPQGYLSSLFRRPDQTIHPFYFGDSTRKRTCLWLKNLPPLIPTHFQSENLFYPVCPPPCPIHFDKNGRGKHWCEMIVRLPKSERAKARSKSFVGISNAMADQWGSLK